MKDISNCKRCTFAQLSRNGAYFLGTKAYIPVWSDHGVKLFREFERRGQSWFFVGEGRASLHNYASILPLHELTEA